jgi:hypothetical protein
VDGFVPLLLAEMLGLSLVLGAVRIARAGLFHRRRAALPVDLTVPVPARLRGGDTRYPGLPQPGRLRLDTMTWHPWLAWGSPARLAGATVTDVRAADPQDEARIFAAEDVVIACHDARGCPFDLFVYDEEAPLVQYYLERAATAPAEADAPGRWRRLQRVLRPSVLTWLTCGAVPLGVWAVLGAEATGIAAYLIGFTGCCWFAAAGTVLTDGWHRRRTAGRGPHRASGAA